ncbi:hypothetical protein MRX96_037900 [Rhipicephalus microplus]
MLKERLVCGIRDRGTQQRLLVEKNFTLDKAVEVAEPRRRQNSRQANCARASGTGSLILLKKAWRTTSSSRKGTCTHPRVIRHKN